MSVKNNLVLMKLLHYRKNYFSIITIPALIFMSTFTFDALATDNHPTGIKNLTCKCKCKTSSGATTIDINIPPMGCGQIYGATCTDKFGSSGTIEKKSCSKNIKRGNLIPGVVKPPSDNRVFIDPSLN